MQQSYHTKVPGLEIEVKSLLTTYETTAEFTEIPVNVAIF